MNKKKSKDSLIEKCELEMKSFSETVKFKSAKDILDLYAYKYTLYVDIKNIIEELCNKYDNTNISSKNIQLAEITKKKNRKLDKIFDGLNKINKPLEHLYNEYLSLSNDYTYEEFENSIMTILESDYV